MKDQESDIPMYETKFVQKGNESPIYATKCVQTIREKKKESPIYESKSIQTVKESEVRRKPFTYSDYEEINEISSEIITVADVHKSPLTESQE